METVNLSDEGRIATKTFILADWRHAAIVDVEKAFENLAEAYESNPAASEIIERIYADFQEVFKGRKEKLMELSQKNKEIAAKAVRELTGE